ncbi:MAG: hypothetical protein AAB463_01110 [Patescibacteria group bacterium]
MTAHTLKGFVRAHGYPLLFAVALFTVGWLILKGQTITFPGVQVGKNALLVVDQRPGLAVRVELAAFDRPGFVVIQYAIVRPGARSYAGATALLAVGEHQGLEIVLSGPSKNGEGYVAVLYADDGDGRFDPLLDKPIADVWKNPIAALFHTLDSAKDSWDIRF